MFYPCRFLVPLKCLKMESNLLRTLINSRVCKFCSQAHKKEQDISLKANNKQLINNLKVSLNCSENTARRILYSYPEISKITSEQLQENLVTLKTAGYYLSSIYANPQVLSKPPWKLYNHVLIVKETSLKKSVSTLLKLDTILKLRISLLKAHKVIKEDKDVIHNLLSNVEDLPPSVAPKQMNESFCLLDAFLSVMKTYLQWKLNVIEEESLKQKIKKSFLKNLSICNMKRNISFLLKEAHFSEKLVLDNLIYLKQMSLSNLYQQAEIFNSQGIDVSSLWQKYPRLLIISCASIRETISILQEFSVPSSAVKHSPQVFALPFSELRQSLKTISDISAFNLYKSNSRFLELIFHKTLALEQLEKFQRCGLKKISLSLFVDRINRKKNLVFSDSKFIGLTDLLNFLANEFDLPKKEIHSKLTRHPFWSTISLSQIKETLRFLHDKKFTNQEIFQSIQIILYPKVRVETELLLLNRRDFKECRLEKNGTSSKNTSVKREFVLPLTLYFLEKDSQFSGYGVWLDSMITDFHEDEDDVDYEAEDSGHLIDEDGDEMNESDENENNENENDENESAIFFESLDNCENSSLSHKAYDYNLIER